MRGSLAALVFVLAIVIATAFLFIAVTGIMILWAIPVIMLSLTFGGRPFANQNDAPASRLLPPP
jgi:hypothetical protein